MDIVLIRQVNGKILKFKKEAEVVFNTATIEANKILKDAEGKANSIKQRVIKKSDCFQVSRLTTTLKNIVTEYGITKKANIIAYQLTQTLGALSKNSHLSMNVKLPPEINCLFKQTCP